MKPILKANDEAGQLRYLTPLFWLYAVMYRFHKCEFKNKLYDIPMENNTNFLITQCRCGKTNLVRAHRESKMYKDWIK